MRIYNLTNESGAIVAFEVNNLLLGRRGACRVASKVPGARVTQKPPLVGGGEEFCEFEVEGEHFVISEPFGDNTRYLVGAKSVQSSKALPLVRRQFELHRDHAAPLRIALAVALLVGITALGLKANAFLAQDKCLDSGGRWNGQESLCEK